MNERLDKIEYVLKNGWVDNDNPLQLLYAKKEWLEESEGGPNWHRYEELDQAYELCYKEVTIKNYLGKYSLEIMVEITNISWAKEKKFLKVEFGSILTPIYWIGANDYVVHTAYPDLDYSQRVKDSIDINFIRLKLTEYKDRLMVMVGTLSNFGGRI